MSCVWNTPLRVALPVVVFVVCVLPVLVVFQASSSDEIFQTSKIKAQIKRANLRRQAPLRSEATIIMIQAEAVRQAETSSIIHEMEEELEKDLEEFRKHSIPEMQRYENERAAEKRVEEERAKKGAVQLPGEGNGSPGRQEEKQKVESSYRMRVKEMQEKQERLVHEHEEENKKQW